MNRNGNPALGRSSRVFMATEALYGLAMGMMGFALNLYMKAQGIPEGMIGALNSWVIVLMGVLAIPLGLYMHRVGRKPMLVAGLMLESAALVVYIFSRSAAHFALGATLMGIGLICVEGTEVQLMYAGLHTAREQATVFSLVFAIFTGMYGAGAQLAGLIASHFAGGWWHYRAILALGAALLLIEALLRAVLLHAPGIAKAAHRPSAAHTRGRWIALDKRLLLFALLPLFQGICMNLIPQFNNLIAQARLGWGDLGISTLLMLHGAALFAFSLLTPWLLNTLGQKSAFAAAYTLNIALAAVLAFTIPPALFVLLFVLRGGAGTLLNNLCDTQLFSALPDEKRDLFAGMRSLTRSLGGAAATALTGMLLQRGDAGAPFTLTALALAIGFVLCFTAILPRLGETRQSDPNTLTDDHTGG